MAWDDLLTVGLRIQSQGWLDVPFWILGGRTGGCMYPSDAAGHEAIMDQFKHRLAGFDNAATYAGIMKAMGALESGVLVWQRDRADTG